MPAYVDPYDATCLVSFDLAKPRILEMRPSLGQKYPPISLVVFQVNKRNYFVSKIMQLNMNCSADSTKMFIAELLKEQHKCWLLTSKELDLKEVDVCVFMVHQLCTYEFLYQQMFHKKFHAFINIWYQ